MSEPIARPRVVFAGQVCNLSAISREAGLHRTYLSHILAGRRDPSLSTCRKLAKAMNCDLATFVESLELYFLSQDEAA